MLNKASILANSIQCSAGVVPGIGKALLFSQERQFHDL